MRALNSAVGTPPPSTELCRMLRVLFVAAITLVLALGEEAKKPTRADPFPLRSGGTSLTFLDCLTDLSRLSQMPTTGIQWHYSWHDHLVDPHSKRFDWQQYVAAGSVKAAGAPVDAKKASAPAATPFDYNKYMAGASSGSVACTTK